MSANPARIVLDGIRNLGEVRWLRRRLGERFALFAIYADPDDDSSVWARPTAPIFSSFRMTTSGIRARMKAGDNKSAGCVDEADVTILNAEHLPKQKLSTSGPS